jgi:Mn-dependent DtxR family transcriptional regulator
MPNARQASALFLIANRRDVADSRRIDALQRKGYVERDPRGNPVLTSKGWAFVEERT